MGDERYNKWDVITSEDLIAYFGIMLVMSMVRLLHLQIIGSEILSFNVLSYPRVWPVTDSLRSTDIFILWTIAPFFFLLMKIMIDYKR